MREIISIFDAVGFRRFWLSFTYQSPCYISSFTKNMNGNARNSCSFRLFVMQAPTFWWMSFFKRRKNGLNLGLKGWTKLIYDITNKIRFRIYFVDVKIFLQATDHKRNGKRYVREKIMSSFILFIFFDSFFLPFFGSFFIRSKCGWTRFFYPKKFELSLQ